MATESNEQQQLFFDVQQKTDKQHILDNPDTYIGSVECVDASLWVMDTADQDKIVEKPITYIPGLFKLFDEGIVNCRDHVVRMQSKVASQTENAVPVTHIDVDISQEDGTITMTNDGNGIDVAERDGVWIPELVFGHLRTSTNYNKDEKKIVGGKNGFGFKLVLIWSTYGRVETVDHIRGLKYVQEYKRNLDEICAPVITKCRATQKPYTKITFTPDYARLGVAGLSEDMRALLKKRVYDISAVTDKTIRVKYNGGLVPVKNFEQYVNLYIGDKTATPRVHEDDGSQGRWEYVVALTPNAEFVQVSFVNGIHTTKGGKHVEYILNQIVRKTIEYIEKKKKVRVNPNTIKEQLILFLRCDIENPAFDSQTKDYMNTPSSKFGSKCDVSDKFIEKIAKLGIMDAALQLTEIKDNREVQRQDGAKTRTVRGIEKLTDANWAGTDKSHLCTLILCEGDSAKTGILSGITVQDRNTVGIFPLKGKLFNVRGESTKRVSANEEIASVVKILGLGYKKEYKTLEDVHKSMRYGRVVFMTDQDKDGSHIKGLCINLFSCEWESLCTVPGFLGYINTPILKATRGGTTLKFYNEGEYERWKEAVSPEDANLWKIKYYKGLGTSTALEFKEYMAERKIVSYAVTDTSTDTIDMAFNQTRASDRKEWLKLYNRHSHVDTSQLCVTYDDFVNKELIHFSKYDCERNIPNLMDGLKISQRKILFAAFKRNLTTEAKVAQFSGYVSEHACYHHGEASLNQTIVGMAQDFVGSNNINLLVPAGQFGTRLMGGKDAASERYIFTYLESIARYIYRAEDDPVLTYLEDDGYPVEPIHYAPILPMILVNGSKGIGTGYSTEIPCHNPAQIIAHLKSKLASDASVSVGSNETGVGDDGDTTFDPYYQDFAGSVENAGTGKYLFKGKYQKVGEDKIVVTELPVGRWTADYESFLVELRDGKPISKEKDKDSKETAKEDKPIVKDFKPYSTDTVVKFEITLTKGTLQELEERPRDKNGCDGVEKCFRLWSTAASTNMHLFGADEILQKFDTVQDIIDVYFTVRLQLYTKRKEYMIQALQKQVTVLANKSRYIQDTLEGHIDLRGKSNEVVYALLESRGYDKGGDEDATATDSTRDHYRYLVKMPMDSVTTNNVERLVREKEKKEAELDTIVKTSERCMWFNELVELEAKYEEYLHARAARHVDSSVTEAVSASKPTTKAKGSAVAKATTTKSTTTKATKTKATKEAVPKEAKRARK